MSSILFAVFIVALAIQTTVSYRALASKLPSKQRNHILRATITSFLLLIIGSLGFLWFFFTVLEPYISAGKDYPLTDVDALIGTLLSLYILLSWVFILVHIAQFVMHKMLSVEEWTKAGEISQKAMRDEAN